MSDPRTTAQGVLELHPKGYGFLRNPARHYAPTAADAYVSGQLIDKFRLAEGLYVAGPLEPPGAALTVPAMDPPDPAWRPSNALKESIPRNSNDAFGRNSLPSTPPAGSASKPAPSPSPPG